MTHDPTVTRCPMCGAELEDVIESDGDTTVCSRCGEAIPSTKQQSLAKSGRTVGWLAGFAVLQLLAIWNGTRGQTEFLTAVVIHTIGLPYYAVVLWRLFRKKLLAGGLSFLVFVVLMELQNNIGVYIVRDVTKGILFETTVERRTGREIYQRMSSSNPYQRTEGPLAENGAPHGKWTTVVFDPNFRENVDWFWHGKFVTEAEFHELESEE